MLFFLLLLRIGYISGVVGFPTTVLSTIFSRTSTPTAFTKNKSNTFKSVTSLLVSDIISAFLTTSTAKRGSSIPVPSVPKTSLLSVASTSIALTVPLITTIRIPVPDTDTSSTLGSLFFSITVVPGFPLISLNRKLSTSFLVPDA